MTLDLMNMILKCLNLGMDLVLFAQTFQTDQHLNCITMACIVDMQLLISTLIFAILQRIVIVKAIKKSNGFFQILISSYGLIMNI